MGLEGGTGVSTDRVAWQEGAGMGGEQEAENSHLQTQA